jgi:imidazolonepropionase-like amidohydrolase
VPAFFAPVLAIALALAPALASAEPIAITHAQVHVRPGETIDGANVIVDRGVITAVGRGLAAPAGARVIDGTGKQVTAGFIEGGSAVGLVGIALEPADNDGRAGGEDAIHDDRIHAAYQARDGFDPGAVAIPVTRAHGVTTVIAAPAGGLFGGQSVAWSLADGAREPLRALASMEAALGAGVLGSRGRAIELLREVLDDARTFDRDPAAYERNQRRALIADRLDLLALAPVLRGALPLVIHARSEADIRAALRVARELRLSIAIAGATEAWRVAPELAAAKVPVLVDPTDNLPSRLEALDVRDDAVAILARAGVAVALSSIGDAMDARNLRQLAGVAIAAGLGRDQALASVTTAPAALYGLADRGTVEKGAAADLVVWSGDPFELATQAEVVIIGGVVQPTRSHQTRLLDRYRRLPAR